MFNTKKHICCKFDTASKEKAKALLNASGLRWEEIDSGAPEYVLVRVYGSSKDVSRIQFNLPKVVRISGCECIPHR